MKKKSASQMVRGATKKNVLLFTVAALALCASPAVALATGCIGQTTWNVRGTGNWFVAANWSGGEPTFSTNAEIDNGGTAQINTPTPTADACILNLGYNATDSGKVSVSNGSLDIMTEAVIAKDGTGNLTITNQGTVTAGELTIAVHASGIGAVSVDGATSSCTISGAVWVGGDNGTPGGTGLMTVTNGGTVSAASVYVWGSGTLTGNGTVSTTSRTTVEGTLEPSGGRLTISSGDLKFTGTSPLMESNVTPTSQDNVYVSLGGATLTGKLKVSMSGTFTPGTTYTLLYAHGGLGSTQFQTYSITYPTGQGFTPVITYDANDVYLYLEPNT